ncbi:AAC(3) family N-acetyltransferase, partial [Streptomyces sp. NPDC002540]
MDANGGHPGGRSLRQGLSARLYGLRAQVLLLGTGFDTCTAFHLGEYRV